MRKILFAIFIFAAFFFWLGNTNMVRAVCQCANWICYGSYQSTYPWGYYETCYCGTTCSTSCGPGTYVCNNGCCDIGPAPGGGTTGSGTGCTQTAPSGMSASRTNPTSAVLNWTPGTGGVYQALWVSTNPDPQSGCAGSLGGTATCPVRADSGTAPLATTQGTYTITNLLTAGTTYYWEVMTVQTDTCYSGVIKPYLSSCDITPSSIPPLQEGTSYNVGTTITSSAGLNDVTFSSSNPTNLSITPPATVLAYPYNAQINALLGGSATLTANAHFTDGSLACSASTPVTITFRNPWWQVKDSDVQSNGALQSVVPSGSYFGLPGAGNFPGVPAYKTTTNLTNLNSSATYGWLANSPGTNTKLFDYAYFANQIPTDILAIMNSNTVNPANVSGSLTGAANHDADNYYWFKYNGATAPGQPLVLNSVDVGTRKVILLVENADLNITGNVNLTDGQGFFMVVVNGNINVDTAVGGGATPNLEGMYFADGTLNDTTALSGGATPAFWARGSLVANAGINMLRDLKSGNAATPAELFEFAPDQIMLFPKVFGYRKISWKEVAP